MPNYKLPSLGIFEFQRSVKDKDLFAPPGSPVKGDRYIIAATGSGDWTGHTKKIALCTVGGGSPSWEFTTPIEGMITWVQDEDLYYFYNGSAWRQTEAIDNFTIEKDASGNLKVADRIELNIDLLAFYRAVDQSKSYYNLIDGFIDEYQDQTGINTGASSGQTYDGVNKLYTNQGLTLDLMEYATDGAAQAAYVTNSTFLRSNGDLDNEDMADISDWTDQDTGTGASTQATYDSKSCMKLDGGVSGNAARFIDLGTYGSRTVLSWSIYHTSGSVEVYLSDAATFFIGYFDANGNIRVYDGASYVTVATVNTLDVWNEWTLDMNWTTKLATLYKNGISVATSIDFSYANPQTSGQLTFATSGLAYIDWELAGSTTSNIAGGSLQSYSESTIKTQGSYSLKSIAAITNSLNKTLTRTVSPTLNLSGQSTIKFSIYASRTGSNIKIGIHDSGGTTTEITPNITSANQWQLVTWDISGVSNANKDVIDSIIITIVNADSGNIFYIDNMICSPNNMILISNVITAVVEPTNSRIVLFEEDIDAVTLNTDLLAYVSIDNGANYDQVTLASAGNYYSTTRRILSGIVNVSARTGTSVIYKIVTANNKALNIRGTALNWE